jgi:lipopolysaccharide biosynthesis glycosyltransferase
MRKSKYCLVTITDTDFVPGTLVLIHSFLKHNPWFAGDIVVLCNQLGPRYRRYFKVYPQIKFIEISKELINRTNALCQAEPKYEHRKGQFYSLDLFKLRGYNKILFMDSDILITGSFKALFNMPDKLITCPDNFHYRDLLRDPVDYSEHELKEGEDPSNFWSGTFSAGMMLIDGSMINDQTHQEIIKLVDTSHFKTVSTNHSDQLILNQYFRGKYKLVDARYNYRFNIAVEVLANENVRLEDAVAIHFTARKKPWNAMHVVRSSFAIGPRYIESYHRWLNEWHELINQIGQIKIREQNGIS